MKIIYQTLLADFFWAFSCVVAHGVLEHFDAPRLKQGDHDISLFGNSYTSCLDECKARDWCTGISYCRLMTICIVHGIDAEDKPLSESIGFVYSERSLWTEQSMTCDDRRCNASRAVCGGSSSDCTYKDCPLPAVTNAYIVQHGNQRTVGAKLSYKCDSNYNLAGSKTIECLQKQPEPTWNGQSPVCVIDGMTTTINPTTTTTSAITGPTTTTTWTTTDSTTTTTSSTTDPSTAIPSTTTDPITTTTYTTTDFTTTTTSTTKSSTTTDPIATITSTTTDPTTTTTSTTTDPATPTTSTITDPTTTTTSTNTDHTSTTTSTTTDPATHMTSTITDPTTVTISTTTDPTTSITSTTTDPTTTTTSTTIDLTKTMIFKTTDRTTITTYTTTDRTKSTTSTTIHPTTISTNTDPSTRKTSSTTTTKHHSGVCDNNWVYYDNACYFVNDDGILRTFDEAKSHCASLGAQLLVPDSQTETDFIESTLLSGRLFSYWIGVQYLNQQWITGSGADPISFHNWKSGYPAACGDGLQPCVVLQNSELYKWICQSCAVSSKTICELH